MASDYLMALASMKQYQKTITQVCNKVQLLQRELHFDAIAFRGISGMSIGFPVAQKLSLPPIIIRKSRRNSHGYHMVETFEEFPTAQEQVLRYLIIDDFIASGKTTRAILKETSSFMKGLYETTMCVGILLYLDTPEGKTKEEKQKEVIYCSYKRNVVIPKFFLSPSKRFEEKKLSQLDKLAITTCKKITEERIKEKFTIKRIPKTKPQKVIDLIGIPSANEEV
jgi:adenine/guanine phosphoribosyltransferase-like PRPP-binding protein